MDIQGIVAELKQEASRIERAIAALVGLGSQSPRRGRPPKLSQAKPASGQNTRQLPVLVSLRREVSGDVQNQLRQPVGVGVDRAIHGRYNRHVRSDKPVVGIQRRHQRLVLAVGP